jgi:hypothetical protein
MDWEWWKDAAAVWGAISGTVLAVLRAFETRPQFQLAAIRFDGVAETWFRISVTNEAKYAIHVSRLSGARSNTRGPLKSP